MQGCQRYQSQLFYTVDLETFIPKNHLLRKIDQQIDFSFVRKITEPFYCSDNGRPSIDPELFFRMLLISYLYGIESDRQLCEEIHYNLAYRWFCRLNLEDKVPDHSSLTKIRDRFGLDIFKIFFNKMVGQCKDKGLVKSSSVMTDGTLIEANAPIESLKTKTSNRSENEEARTQSSKQAEKMKISNKTHVSQTDPDATLAFKAEKARGLKYKAHITMDAQSRIILDTKITTGVLHDSKTYLEQLQTIIKNHKAPIEEAIADRAYGSGEILQALIDKKIEPIIPLFSSRSGGSILIEKESFIYDEEHDRYECLARKFLIPYPSLSDGRKTYHSNPMDCVNCMMSKTCKAMHHSTKSIRIVNRNVHQKIFEQIKQQSKTNIFRQKLTERFWKMEGIISEAKNLHGLARARYRGLKKMQIQAYLSASAQNIKRLVLAFLYYYFYFIPKATLSNELRTVRMG